ncbi:MAG: rane-anchored mycosin [Actinomycetota bacterium]|nr:rane-anchored mycosin [Actinomycetota bacterium]
MSSYGDSSSADTNGKARVVHTLAGSYLADEMVVALAYDSLILAELVDWGAVPVLLAQDRDDRLGLGRVTLQADRAVAWLTSAHQDWVHTARAAAEQDGYEPSDLDVMIRCLRLYFIDRFNGWVPEFGKNRIMSRVQGSYVVDGGGNDGGPRERPEYVLDNGAGGSAQHPPAGHSTILVPPRGAMPGDGVRVGVVDTRVAQNPWLAGGYIARGIEILPGQMRAPLPATVEHGTFVSGLIMRQAPGATVVFRQGLDDQASQDSWSVARIIADLASNSTDVVNLSLGCLTDDNQAPLVLKYALDALGPRTIAVAAAGNHGETSGGLTPSPAWPAALDAVVAVGAADGDHRASFSPDAPWVDAVAPGVDVVSTVIPKGSGGSLFAAWSGTSFAAAAVSGAIAARTALGKDAREAWACLQSDVARDEHDRPVIPLAPLGSRASHFTGAELS